MWGGAEGCEHEWTAGPVVRDNHYDLGTSTLSGTNKHQMAASSFEGQSSTCARCGAWRGQYGLEPTPELYVEHTLDVLRGIRRVLRPDGVVWWNIGDGYSGSWGNFGARNSEQRTVRKERYPRDAWEEHKGRPPTAFPHDTLKPKDMVLMPFRVALAAQADGWWVRSVVVWNKPNAMPESVTDRPTGAHEYVIMLTKSARYWYDADAVREKADPSKQRSTPAPNVTLGDGRTNGHDRRTGYEEGRHTVSARNLRSVWTFPTAQTPEAHFATFPPELPRRCIEASCPKAICVRCGEARVRITKDTYTASTPGGRRPKQAQPVEDGFMGATAVVKRADGDEVSPSNWKYGRAFKDSETVGWTSCDCAEPEYQPGLVLDPFAGVGTTGYVALQLGRRFVGIELSEKYAAIARTKLETWWRPGKITEPDVPDGQAALFEQGGNE